MSRPVYLSTTAFAPPHLDDILEVCERRRIDALELSAVGRYDLDRLGRTPFPSRFLVHNYFPPPPEPFVLNLASQNADVLSMSRAHCGAAIALSAKIGGPVYAAHGGYLADLWPGQLGDPASQASMDPERLVPYERGYATLLESSRQLADEAARQGVRFLIENHVLSPLNGPSGTALLPMVRGDELARLARDVDRASFGILVDVGHLNVAAGTLGFDRHGFIDTVAPYIGGFHLSANDGVTDQHRGFGPDAWFLPRLREFPDAVITLELSRVSIDELLAVRDVVETWV